ncbi:hypothetical protein EVAR_35282_1 [Eumeta japonica]|uniref:Uncharacterized protein n=1 Tax=Eumeta variegata TaxID=151549 RepID=A0A4C1VD27_EUMVA|nr:hypothetical protein EVAR_35282_1 [Eumeta japonica]
MQCSPFAFIHFKEQGWRRVRRGRCVAVKSIVSSIWISSGAPAPNPAFRTLPRVVPTDSERVIKPAPDRVESGAGVRGVCGRLLPGGFPIRLRRLPSNHLSFLIKNSHEDTNHGSPPNTSITQYGIKKAPADNHPELRRRVCVREGLTAHAAQWLLPAVIFKFQMSSFIVDLITSSETQRAVEKLYSESLQR